MSRIKYISSHYRYEMFEDVHQVANYLELKVKEEPNNKLIADYAFMSLRVVLISIVIQMILVSNLAWEVFQKDIQPSNEFFPLRMVLLVFMIFLFNSEQTSIEKSNQLSVLGRTGYKLAFTNFLR